MENMRRRRKHLCFFPPAPLIQGKGAVETYKAMVGYMGIEDCGVCALSGEENKNEGKMAEIKAWAKGL